jgi:hypothetical protein
MYTDSSNAGFVPQTSEPIEQVNRKKRLPSGLPNIIATAKTSVVKWRESGFTLKWITPDEFEDKVAVLDSTVVYKSETQTKRSPISHEISELNDVIDQKLGNLKGYLIGKFGHKEASSHYGRFGIEHKGTAFRMSRASEDRRRALDMLISAIDEYDIPNSDYGKDYWTDIRTRFNALIDRSGASAGLISQNVAEKNLLAEEVLMTMNALIALNKANFPKTWQAEIRAWGFQKEKY